MQISFSKALLLATTSFSMITASTANAYLSPLSFQEMYAHASKGNLSILNNAILRGMNINAVNSDGDTGICVAIRRNDHIAYQSLRNAGAHPHPPCVNSINQKQYKKFMVDHRPYEPVYTAKRSNLWWWIGGAAAVGGIAALAGGGGGGGGSSGSTSSEPSKKPEDPNFHTDKGLSYIVGTTSPSEPEGETYSAVLVAANNDVTQVNREAMNVSNDAKMWVYNADTFAYDTVALADLINFDADVNLYTKYIQVGMKAYNKSVVINDNSQTISLGNNTVALDASLYGSASNLGTIEVKAKNGTVAMVAGDYSSAGNRGKISMEFSGKTTGDQIMGMYADTNSSITNSGTVSAKADNAFGKVTGMQARLTGYYADFVNTASNGGEINLAGSSNDSGALSLWGMSSWLDKAFIKSNQSAEKLDKATLINNGTVTLSLALQKSDEEGAAVDNPLSLADGTGGVVGMHADARTDAAHNGLISIIVSGDGGESMAAGMQAVRGGNIVNGKNIEVTGEGSAYGMMAVSGANSGSNFTNAESSVINKGNIIITAADTGYGISSEVRGDVHSSGNIQINGAGYGIFNQNGNTETAGSITIAGTGEKKSYGIYAQAATDEGYGIKNAADISMTFVPEEKEEGGDEEETPPTPPSNYGIYGWNVDIDNSGKIVISQFNENAADVFGILSEEAAINNRGEITVNGNGSAVYATGADLVNSGVIALNGSGYGLIAEDGNLTNSGSVTLNGYGYGITASGGNLTNSGAVNLNGSGWGIMVENGNLTNEKGGNVLISADDQAPVYGLTLAESGYQLNNQADITLTSEAATITKVGIGINGNANTVTNTGNIRIGGTGTLFNTATGIYSNGGTVNNSGTISLYGGGSGIYVSNGTLTNAAGGNIAVYAENNRSVYGIQGLNNSTVNNQAQIDISSTAASAAIPAYGIFGNTTHITNRGDIKIGDNGNMFTRANGIFAQTGNVSNAGTVRIYGAGNGIAVNGGNIDNRSGGNITMVLNGNADSYGLRLNGTAGAGHTLINRAIVKLNRSSTFSDGKKIGGLFAQNADINNFGSVEIGTAAAAIHGASGLESVNGNIGNQGAVMVYGHGAALKAVNGNITNNRGGNLNIYTDGKAFTYGIYANGTVSNTVNNQASIMIGQLGGYAQAAEGTASSYGIWTDNAKIINSGDVSLGNSSGSLTDIYGLYASANGSIENSGVINLYNAGTAIYTQNGAVRNLSTSGIINIVTDGSKDSYGIRTTLANNNEINNQNRISITAKGSAYSSSHKNTGIYGNKVRNSGNIQIGSTLTSMSGAYGIFANNIVNSGNLLLFGNGNIGLYSESARADISNDGTVSVTSSGTAYGIRADKGKVVNRGVITMNSSASYGILATTIENHAAVNINQATGYGLAATDGGSVTNYGKITASGSQNDGIYGKGASTFHNEGDIEISGDNSWGLRSSNNTATYNSGSVIMNSTGSYGLLLTKGTVDNLGDVTVKGNNSYAIRVNNVTRLTNSGTLTVGGNGSYGIYAEGSSVVDNNGQINVNGTGSYGIYALDTAQVTNRGNIYLNPLTAETKTAALYAGGNANIVNNGKLYIKGSGDADILAAYTEDNGKIVNNGTVYVAAEADKNTVFSGDVTNNGTITVGAGTLSLNRQVKFNADSRFAAARIDGEATVAAQAVQQSNQTRFTLHNNFEGDTAGLTNVTSESYLFDADFDGKTTTLTMKTFDEVEDNASIADFLSDNYGKNNNTALYDALKSATSQTALTGEINRRTGRDFIPALAARDIEMMKDVGRQLDNAWFNAAANDGFITGLNYYNRRFDGNRLLSGSDDKAVSLFGLLRNTADNRFSYGLGWNFIHADSKFDNRGNKEETIARLVLPFGFAGNGYGWFGNLYGAYGSGDYKRYADGQRYKGDLTNYYYGLNNELRGKTELGYGFALQPTAELNLTGLYQSGIDDGELNIRHTNSLSVESGLGLYLQKQISLTDQNLLQIRFGGSWYHEFNNEYQAVKARINDMDGEFAMDRCQTDKDHGLFSVNGEYRSGNFSLYGEAAYDLGTDDNWIFNGGAKYAF